VNCRRGCRAYKLFGQPRLIGKDAEAQNQKVKDFQVMDDLMTANHQSSALERPDWLVAGVMVAQLIFIWQSLFHFHDCCRLDCICSAPFH